MITSSSWDVVTFSMVLTFFCHCAASTPIEVNMGKAVYLPCSCNLSEVHVVEWKHGEERIMIHGHLEVEKTEKGYRSRRLNENNIYQLEIYLNKTKDLGSYICLQYTSSGKPEKMAWILQLEMESASAVNELTATVGETIRLECSSSASYLASVDWKRNGVSVIKHDADHIGELNDGRYTSRIFQSNVTARLEISDLRKGYDGNYSCLLFQTSGRHIGDSWKVHIKENGKLNEETATAFLGESVTFTCIVDTPKSNLVAIFWYHESEQILHHNVNVKMKTNGKYISAIDDDYDDQPIVWLKISWLGHDDSGKYSCALYLATGDRERSHWNLYVKGDQRKEMTKLVSLYDFTELDCSSDLPDVAAFQWTRRSIGQVSPNALTTMNFDDKGEKNNSSLQIFHAKFEDAGKYSCFSFSKNNKTQETSWTLQIQGYPQLTATANAFRENDTVNSKCCVKFGIVPVTSYKIEWLMNGREHTFDKHNENATEANLNSNICSSLQFSVTRAYHGQSLDCWVQNELNRTSSLTLSVFYSPNIINVRSYSSAHFFNKEEVFITCTVDANPFPSVALEKELKNGTWEILSSKSNLKSEKGTITSWKFLLLHSQGTSFRCIAFNGYGSTAVSYEIKTTGCSVCIFDGARGVVFMIIVAFICVICFALLILKITACSKVSGSICSYLKKRERKATVCERSYSKGPAIYGTVADVCSFDLPVPTDSKGNEPFYAPMDGYIRMAVKYEDHMTSDTYYIQEKSASLKPKSKGKESENEEYIYDTTCPI